MRALIAAIAYTALLIGSHARAQEQPVAAVVDLNRPGMLEALAESNPLHHSKIVEILDQIRHHQMMDVPDWLHVSFDARDVKYTPVLLVSNPPKRDLSFVLGSTRYKARITLDRVQARIAN
jgi:hypothetical protein